MDSVKQRGSNITGERLRIDFSHTAKMTDEEKKKVEDALHVAVATLAEMDAVVSWNFRHLANLRKAELFYSVNLSCGFHKKVEIITPWEVIGYVED